VAVAVAMAGEVDVAGEVGEVDVVLKVPLRRVKI